MTTLVTLETQTIKFVIGESSKKTRSFAESTPPLGRGDIEEERVFLRALRLSERERLGIDARRDSSSGGDSVSEYSDAYLMSEDDSLVDSMDAESPCTSTPGSGNTCQKSKCDGQISSKESGDEMACDVVAERNSKMTDAQVTFEKTNLESTKMDSSCEIQFKSEAVAFVKPGKLIELCL